MPSAIADEQAVRVLIDRYRQAYARLDAGAAREIWPRVDERALARAFDQLSMQEIDFAACDVNVAGDRASAGCTGNARYVPKVGSKTPRVENRVWNFDLRKNGTDWRIERVESK